MKKLIVILAAGLAIAACAKVAEPEAPATDQGVSWFTGTPLTTRVTVGDKVGSTYPALWSDGDVLKIVDVSTDAELGTATLVDGAGQKTGKFSTSASIADDTSIKLVYGSDSIAADQTQAAPGGKDLSAITYAESAPITFKAGTNMPFAMTHTPAIVKVSVSSSDFSDLQLTNVSVFSAGSSLCDGTVTDRVGVTFTTPAALSGTQEAWFVTKPVAVAADFYVVATMKGTYSGTPGTTVQIPVKFTGKTLDAGKVNSIDMTGLTLSDCDVDWYNPVCTRYIPAEGWCYGNSNCIVVAPTANSTVDFDMRAQGDFFNAMRYGKKPHHARFVIGDAIKTSNWTTWSIDGNKSASATDLPFSSLTPEIGRSGDAISSSRTSSAAYFTINASDDSVLWAFVIWASTYSEKKCENGIVMDRNIGQYEPSSETQAADAVQLYYQWGRPFGFGYGNSNYGKVTDGVSSLAESASNAGSYVCRTTDENDYRWLKDDPHPDLWGNTEQSSTSTGGVKSIFDPCPKGWKVVSPAILQEVVASSTLDNKVFSEYIVNMKLVYDGDTSYWCLGGQKNGSDASRSNNNKRFAYFSDTLSPSGTMRPYWAYGNLSGESVPLGLETNRASHASPIRCMKDTANR